MDYKARYEEWISNSYFDEDTRAELESIKEDEKEIKGTISTWIWSLVQQD